jgi:hypothetical protein
VSRADNLNVRSGPGTNYVAKYQLKRGEIFMYVDYVDKSDYFWWKIKYFDFNRKWWETGFIATGPYRMATRDEAWVGILGNYYTPYGQKSGDPSGGLPGSKYRYIWAGLVFDKYETSMYNGTTLEGWTTLGKEYGTQEVIDIYDFCYSRQCQNCSAFLYTKEIVLPPGWVKDSSLYSVGAKIPCFYCGAEYPERMFVLTEKGGRWVYWGCNGGPNMRRLEYPFTVKHAVLYWNTDRYKSDRTPCVYIPYFYNKGTLI